MFLEFLNKHNIKDKTIAVGVSGGSDSLGLILAAHHELVPKGYKIIALTVDHRLRPSSAQEAEYVKTIMQKNSIEHHILVWNKTEQPVADIENAARKARYGLIADWCKINNVRYVMTAHHLHDQAETFFMRLQRGSGLYGLCGMQEVFCRRGLYILRPLLNTNPQVMKDFLLNNGIAWIEDESNDSEDYLRVKMRHALPDFYKKTGLTAEKIVNTMQRLQCSRNYLETEIRRFIDQSFHKWFDYAYSCRYEQFLDFDDEIKFRLLAYLLQNISQSEYAPRAEKILSLIDKLKNKNFRSATLGYCYLCRFNDYLWIFPEDCPAENYSAAAWKTFQKNNPQYRKIKLPFRLRVYILTHQTSMEEIAIPF